MNSNGEARDSPSPSFSSYLNTNLAEVVARVATDFTAIDDGDFFSNNGDSEDGDEFEFNLIVPEDGVIRPVYPVFDRDLLRDFDLVESRPSDHEENLFTSAQIQLKDLFLEDRDGDTRLSSSEEDELEEIPHGTYCVWTPNKSPMASPSPERCTKSNSTGSSAVTEKVKAWKLRDLLKRSKSDGKDQCRLILLTRKKKNKDSVCSVATASAAGRAVRKTAARGGSLIGMNKAVPEKNKRRTYLPYRQDLLGFSTHLRPFG